MWLFYLGLAAIASSKSVIAFPQNDQLFDSNAEIQTIPSTFEVDGFVFDGPADRPLPEVQRTTSSSTTTIPSTTMTTTTASADPQFDQCVSTCPTTPEYNPVCGSDNVEYGNPGRLNCASTCGKNITLKYYGRCITTKIRGR